MPGKTARALTVIFIVLTALNLAYLAAGFLSIPRYYERVTTLTIPPVDLAGVNSPTNQSVLQSAGEHGLTLKQYAIEQIVFHIGVVVLCLAVAGVIMIRARWNWFAWYSAFFLTFIAEFAFFNEIYVAVLLPLWIYEVGALFWPLILLYFYLFPNGKPEPRIALWVLGPFLIFHFAVQTLGFLSFFLKTDFIQSFMNFVIGPAQGFIFIVFPVILACQVYRYRRIASREEKQQTKWFVMGFVLFIVLSSASELLGDRNPYQREIGLLIFMFVPLSVGIAILRYRLWDIDLVIRRTLQYSVLTVLLGLVYFGGVTLLQSVFTATAGQQSPLAVVLSTLGIAVLFTPLRRSLQTLIDRRFYRRRYDAENVLQRFVDHARVQADLDHLAAQLVHTVEDSVEPATISMWLAKNKSQLSNYGQPKVKE